MNFTLIMSIRWRSGMLMYVRSLAHGLLDSSYLTFLLILANIPFAIHSHRKKIWRRKKL